MKKYLKLGLGPGESEVSLGYHLVLPEIKEEFSGGQTGSKDTGFAFLYLLYTSITLTKKTQKTNKHMVWKGLPLPQNGSVRQKE